MPQTVKFQDKMYSFPDKVSREQILKFLKGQIPTQDSEILETPEMIEGEDGRVISKANANLFSGGFEGAVAYTFENEGGFSDNPDDSGGMTNLGISSAAHPDEDIKNMDEQRATEIYLDQYWNKPRLGKITDKRVATKIFDHGVLNGETTNVLRIQRMLGVKATGVINDATVKAIEKMGSEAFLKAYQKDLTKYYKGLVKKDPKNKTHIEGWLNRTNRLPEAAAPDFNQQAQDQGVDLSTFPDGEYQDANGNIVTIKDGIVTGVR